MPVTVGIRLGACSARYKIEQLETMLQQKTAQLQKLERINRVLSKREQMVSRCIAQQADMLYHLGRLVFTIPDTGHEEYEQKATAAMAALLKDMEAAQLMQVAENFLPDSSKDEVADAENHKEQKPLFAEQFTNRVLRTFLERPDYVQTMRQLHGASLEELADIMREKTMQLGFAMSRYPGDHYIQPAELEAIEDVVVCRRKMQAAARLQESIDDIATTVLLLHVTHDKILNLSMLDLETMQPETPSSSFWEVVLDKLQLRPDQIAELHTGFVWYSQKRTLLTQQMQQTMDSLQLLLGPLEQQQQPQQGLAGNLAGNAEVDIASAAEVAALQSNSEQSGRSTVATTSTDGGGSGNLSSGNLSRAAASGSRNFSSSFDGSFASMDNVGSLSYQGSGRDMLENMEAADELLQQLGRLVWQLREVSRCLIFQFSNALDPYQMSLSVIHSWPFIMQPPPILEVMVKREVEKQQQAEKKVQQQSNAGISSTE